MWRLLLTGFVVGVAAIPHCLGMCGAFPLILSKRPEGYRSTAQQVAFVCGKCFTYVFLGALAGTAGIRLLGENAHPGWTVFLKLALGAVTITFGLAMLGLKIRQRWIPGSAIMQHVIGGLPKRNTAATAFLLGLGVGFLPCPLPMGMLAVAVASHDVLKGMALMAGVGLGTSPGLLVVGILGIGLNRRLGRIGMSFAGIVVIGIGLLNVTRTINSIVHTGAPPPACCQNERGF